jgi:thioredoxin reductase/NAD-dependent dihydropyrimidine dehydrogenase PreA subunit
MITQVVFEQFITYSFVALFIAIVVIIYLIKQKRESKRYAEKMDKAIEQGTHEPVTLHPVIDPNSCIKSGACVNACPEKDVIGIINGRATVINASRCIGHGACLNACPVKAITLVIGTEKRGIEIPYLDATFETNVPGIYIAGEMGGMGLIKNAIEQGKQAVENIALKMAKNHHSQYDLIIVGAGPAGIAATLTAKKHHLKTLTIEQESLGGTVASFPRAKIVMTSPAEIPLYGKIKLNETNKSELIKLWTTILDKNDIRITENSKVESIVRQENGFEVTTQNGDRYSAQKILLAIGRRGTPRKLNVPGEEMEKVSYRLIEPEHIQGKNILVVGGGDSAVEAAMLLADENKVTLSYRGEAFQRIKQKNSERVSLYQTSGKLKILFDSNVKQIDEKSVILNLKSEATEVTIENDQVFIFAGGELPTQFLEKIGIKSSVKYGETILKPSRSK